MKKLLTHHLPLYVCVLMSTIPATAGPDRISPCPASPNCVSSRSKDSARFIEPLHYAGDRADARQKLIELLDNSKHVRLISVETDYLHAEFRSFVFNFVDDVEFHFPSQERIIHVRSASRTGYYDFGVNRRRVEQFRARFENLPE